MSEAIGDLRPKLEKLNGSLPKKLEGPKPHSSLVPYALPDLLDPAAISKSDRAERLSRATHPLRPGKARRKARTAAWRGRGI